MLKLLLLGLIFILPNVFCNKVRYDNYTLYKVSPKNAEHIKLLQNLKDGDTRYDFWSDSVTASRPVTILSSPEAKGELENLLKLNNVDFDVTLKNVQEAMDKETVKSYNRFNLRSMTWDAYYKLDDIYTWMEDLASTYSDVASIIVIGESIEGREIKGLKISHGSGRRAIFLESGIHAREWIAPATVNYIANELLTSEDEETKAAAAGFDWYIFPVTNPDGYVYSHEVNRMWRKNRRYVGNLLGFDLYGIDLNRNWNSNWLIEGSSLDATRDDYAGGGPFSEPETRLLSAYIETISDKLDMYLSFHSFSQLLLLPFGNSTGQYANYDEAIQIGRRAMGALAARFGTHYPVGNIPEVINYKATGGSIDWVKEKFKTPLVYCYELRDDGYYGFLLPTDQILPNNLEVMDSILELVLQAQRFGIMARSGAGALNVSLALLFMAMLAKFL